MILNLAATPYLSVPGDIFFLLLLAVGVAWWMFGTISIRACASLVLMITKPSTPSATVDEPSPGKTPALVSPDLPTAVGIVLLNAITMGACVSLAYLYRGLMAGLGGALSPLQSIGLVAAAFVIGLAIVVRINRSALHTDWLCSSEVTVGYLVFTTLMSVGTWFLFLYALGK